MKSVNSILSEENVDLIEILSKLIFKLILKL